ncbi:LysR family transcriptional regulator [Carnimonas nigrificans]|uniref:LysR family transcriptional regulator n=1 Tax=Carnimonas nigrificans TaxID=64323 RepID=UPI00046E85FD|nr:LysR family transcriptional regulator [Carnimonas nigrificans]
MKKPEKNKNVVSKNENKTTQKLIWDDIAVFLAIARHGTLSAASLRMGTGIATLSRHIDRLEKALGVPLFLRQQSGYTLTREGCDLIEKAEAMESAALALTSDAHFSEQVSGTVRLATAENLATGLILPNLTKFQATHPNILVEVITNISTVNIHRHEADLAIRMVKPQRGNVSFRRLGIMGYGLYASIDYIRRQSSSAEYGSHENAAFIAWSDMFAHLSAAQWIERILRGRRPSLVTTSLTAQISAATAGLGMAVLPHFAARNAGLVCVDSDIGVDQPIYLVIQSDLAQSRRTRAVADFLSELIIDNREVLEG